MQTSVKTLDAGSAGTIELADSIFGLEPRQDLLSRMVRYQLLKRMAGTHHAQDRSEVNVTGKKMYKQKGTGSARHGDKSVPQWRGGGKAFGPKPRSHAIELPKKVRALALRHALSAKAKAGDIVVIDNAAFDAGKTKALRSSFEKLELTNALIIDGAELQVGFVKAARNIPNIDVLPVQGINVYDILRRHKLVLTKAAVEALEAVQMSTTTAYDVILSPVITEKSTRASVNNQVVFNVRSSATKPQIKAAVEQLFSVKVKAVNTSVRKGKKKVFKGKVALQSDVKKAVVTLEQGHMIDVMTGL